MSRRHHRKKHREKIVYVVKGHPFYKNMWFYISLFLLVSLAVSTTNSTNKQSKTNSKTTEVKENVSTSIDEDNAQDEDKLSESEIEFKEVASTDKFEFRLNQVGETEEIRESDFFSYRSDNGKYALINLYIRNTSDSLVSIESSSFKLMYGDKKYSPSLMIGLGNDFINFESLNPGMDTTGNIVFEVPKDVPVQDCILKLSLFDLFSNPIEFKLK